MNYPILCTIHNVRFGSEAPMDAVEETALACRIMNCPACEREWRQKTGDELNRVTAQRDALLKVIEIKQEHLRIEVNQETPLMRENRMLREANASLVATEQGVRSEKNRLQAQVAKLHKEFEQGWRVVEQETAEK